MSAPAGMKKVPPPLPPKPRSLLRRMSMKKHAVQDDRDAILLMGATGAGKSSFIASLGLPAKVGHTLKSCTVDPEGWEYQTTRGNMITIIDTPGFNDSSRPDLEILQAIVDYIVSAKLRVVLVLYMQRVNERRLSGSIRTNLAMLRAIAGPHFYQNVVLATSMWSTIPLDGLAEARQREMDFLRTHAFWGELVEKGAVYYPWDETGTNQRSKTADEIINLWEGKTYVPELNIILEVNKCVALEDTEAGRILTAELRKRQEKEKQRLEEEEMQLRELQQQRAELEAEAARTEEEVRMQQRRSRRESLVLSSPRASVQAAQQALGRREPVVYSSSPQAYPYLPGEDAPPCYEADNRYHCRSSSPPRESIERRHTAEVERRRENRERMSVDATDRTHTPHVVVRRSDDERRGRRARRTGLISGLLRGHSEYVIVRKRRD